MHTKHPIRGKSQAHRPHDYLPYPEIYANYWPHHKYDVPIYTDLERQFTKDVLNIHGRTEAYATVECGHRGSKTYIRVPTRFV